MKKRISLTLACLLILILALTSCSGTPSSSAPAPVQSSVAPSSVAPVPSTSAAPVSAPASKDYSGAQYITVATGGVGGSWYILNAAANDLWEQKIEGIYMTMIPGGGSSNPTVVNNKGAQIGMTYAGNAKDAITGGTPEFPEPLKEICALSSLNMKQYLTILVTADLGIKNFEDIKEKKPALNCSIGPRGSGSAQMFVRAFESHGITIKDIESWGGRVEFTSPQDGGNGIRDGQLNVLSGSSPLKNPYMLEAATARDLVLLELNPTVITEMCEKYGYTASAIPKGTYDVPNDDVPSIADVTMMICRKDLSEDLAYDMIKAMCENKEFLATTHNLWASFEPKAVKNVPIPLHPGVEKYIKEMGY